MLATKSPEISVLLVNYGSLENLNDFLGKLSKFLQGIQYEILIFNNSTNVKFPKGLRVFSVGKNIGYGNAINYLSQVARGKYFLICNLDVKFNAKLFDTYQEFLSTDLETFVLSLGKQDKLYSAPIITRLTAKTRFSGYAFLIDGDAFKSLGGFEPELFLYFEDDDLAKRLESFNFKTYFPNKPLVEHLKNYTLTFFSHRSRAYYMSLNSYLKLHHKGWFVIWYFPIKILTFLLNAFRED